MRLRARTLSGIPGGFLYAPRKMLRAEAWGHNSQLALLRQVSPGLQRIFQRASSLHPGGPCPESHRRWVLAGVRDEGKVVVGERGGGSWTMRGALWAPRHREVVDRALLSCSLIFGTDMIECR